MTGLLTETLLPIAASNTVVALVLALAAVLVTRLRMSPTLAHCLWVLVLVKLVTPPLFTVDVPLPRLKQAVPDAVTTRPDKTSPRGTDDGVIGDLIRSLLSAGGAAVDGNAANGAAAGTPVHDEATGLLSAPDEPIRESRDDGGILATVDWAAIGLVLWLAGAALALCGALYRALRFHRGLRHARPAPTAVRREARALGTRLGLRRTPSVELMPGQLSPMLWCLFGKPKILLPDFLQQNLTEAQKRSLLAHELAHYRRRDHWVRLLELVVRTIYWFHPLVWWTCRELRAVEEECCDAWVVWALPDASRSYADALLHTVEFLSDARTKHSLPATASGMGNVTNLKRRLIMIMKGNNRRTLGHLGRAAVLGLAAVTLPLVPAFGQERERKATHTVRALKENIAEVHQALQRLRRADEVDRKRVDELEIRAKDLQDRLRKFHAVVEVHEREVQDRAHEIHGYDQDRQNDQQKHMMRALKKAVELLRESRQNDDAKALLILLENLQRNDNRNRDDYRNRNRDRDERIEREQHLVHVQQEVRAVTELLHNAERAMKDDKAAHLRRALQDLSATAESLQADHQAHAERRAREEFRGANRRRGREGERELDRRRDRERDRESEGHAGTNDRVRRLEKQVAELTEMMGQLLRQRRDGERRNRRDGERRERRKDDSRIREEVEEEEIEEEEETVVEEEIEEVKEVKEIEAIKKKKVNKARRRAKKEAEWKKWAAKAKKKIAATRHGN